jgi:antitoxin HicB
VEEVVVKNYPVEVRWSDEDEAWIADVYDLPGCLAHGKTRAAAVKAADEAAALWLEVAAEEKRPIPEPSTNEASGNIALRLPKSLHVRLRRAAERDGVSLNQHIAALLAERNAVHEAQGPFETLLREHRERIDRVIAKVREPEERVVAAHARVMNQVEAAGRPRAGKHREQR